MTDPDVPPSAAGALAEPAPATQGQAAGSGSTGSGSTAAGSVDSAPAEPEAGGDPADPRAASGRSWVLIALAAACALLAVAAVVLGFQLRRHAEVEDARQDALRAARQSALNLTSIDNEQFDQAVQRVLDGATGDFRREFEDNTESLKKLLAENQVNAQGSVLEAGLVRADRSNATALVVVDSTVRNVATPEGRVNTYRMQIEVERVEDRWLTSGLRFVG